MSMGMRAVWKYSLPPGVNRLDLPKGASILSVHGQNDVVCLWVLVEPSADTEPRDFFLVPTGEQFAYHEQMVCLGTVHLRGGALVFHVFEEVPL